MANKVLSIKMDEKDIKKLNNYYEALLKAGIISKESLSKNAFYKHLILDYLKQDVSIAIDAFNKCAFVIAPSEEDEKEFSIANPYGLSKKGLAMLSNCFSEMAAKQRKEFEEAVSVFEDISDGEIICDGGSMPQFYVVPDKEDDVSFWMMEMFESRRKFEENFAQNELGSLLGIIEEASINNEDKEKLILELKEKYNKRKEYLRKLKA